MLRPRWILSSCSSTLILHIVEGKQGQAVLFRNMRGEFSNFKNIMNFKTRFKRKTVKSYDMTRHCNIMFDYINSMMISSILRK